MSTILYYSNYCEHSRKLLQAFSKTDIKKDIHFICIDKRVKDNNNKTFIVLENGNRILMPENISRVPALLLLTQGYNVLYGDAILQHFKPTQERMVKQATQNNMEPMAFSFGGGGGFGDIVSDQYSFLDQAPEDLEAKGNGGRRQMHNYVDLNTAFSGQISQHSNNEDTNTTIRGAKKMGDDASNQMMDERMKKMREDRDADIRSITGNKPPMSF
jgi:hypothetical protein